MKAVKERDNWWPNNRPIVELTNSRVRGRILTDREMMPTVDSYTTFESGKIQGITRLLLSSGKNKSLDLIVIDSINTPISEPMTAVRY